MVLFFRIYVLGSDVCFNQRTGEPIKWYVLQPGGQFVLFDSPGYDQAGAQKKPANARICRIIQLQKQGVRPREVAGDPRTVKYFDEISGQPRIWYGRRDNGQLILFDAEGVDPVTGKILDAINSETVKDIQAQAAAKQAEAERNSRIESERKEAEAKATERLARIALFDAASYSSGVVILGARPQRTSDASVAATREVVEALTKSLRKKGIASDDFRPRVYTDDYFKTLFSGNVAILDEVGLRQKMRAAFFAQVDSNCRPGVADLTSCTVTMQMRVLGASGSGSLKSVSEIGAGTTTDQAVARAAELIVERHGDLFDGI